MKININSILEVLKGARGINNHLSLFGIAFSSQSSYHLIRHSSHRQHNFSIDQNAASFHHFWFCSLLHRNWTSSMEEASQPTTTTTAPNPNPSPSPNPNPNNDSILSSIPVWPTIDGPLGLTEEDSLSYARRFYKFGYALLPWLWAVNCFYFWPVLRHSRAFPNLRPCKFPFLVLLFIKNLHTFFFISFVNSVVFGELESKNFAFSFLLEFWASSWKR